MWSSEYTHLFTVVCACYNAEAWIQDLFASLSRQTADFTKHVQVVFVDDGSTDGTAALTKNFVATHPHNTLYVYKENGGPASARNYGIPLARGEWITFTDSDDFLADDYFENVLKFIDKENFDGNVIACSLISFYEKNKNIINNHPLNFKFAGGDTIIDLNEYSHYIQLFINSSFIKNAILKKTKCTFDDRVKPTFEDAHLLNRVLLFSNNYKIGYLQSAVYYYRKRSTEDSLIATSWNKQERYTDQLLFGYLNLVQVAKQACSQVPKFIQNVIIYDTHWYLERLLRNSIPYRFSQPEFDRFLDLMRLIFSYVDAKNILFSKLPMLSLRTRIAMLYAFQKINITEAPFCVQEISPDMNAVQVVHYSGAECDISFTSANRQIHPLWEKTIRRTYLKRHLCVEQIAWLPFDVNTQVSCCVEGKEVQAVSRESCYDVINKHDILSSFYLPASALPEHAIKIKNMAASSAAQEQFAGCWLLTDRVHKADDNAEHLYRWLMHKPDFAKKIYFVLDARSADWDRLAGEGFKLLAYRSDGHKAALWNAEWLISSHADIAVRDPLGIRDVIGSPKYKFAFLQHGIIKDDMSEWLNTIRLDMFVASTQREYESLVAEPYKFCAREVELAGLPRHDRLLEKARAYPKAKNLLLCPTWRWYLPPLESLSGEPSNEVVQQYLESDFFKGWNKLFSSQQLAKIAEDHKIKLLFLPHPKVERSIDHYTTIPAIRRIAYQDIKSIQDLIVSCGMMITDYSSLAMDFAYLGRPVFYYQFPETHWFFGGDLIRPGYFTYAEDGFGPVLDNHEALLESIRLCLERGGVREARYDQRAQAFFTLRDGQNCARVFDAVMRRS